MAILGRLVARSQTNLRALALTGGSLTCVGLALLVKQGAELGSEWKTQLRMKATACRGPTEGLERRSRAHELLLDVTSVASSSVAPQPGAKHTEAPLLFFLGDSLVSGVGAQSDDAPAPAALPKSVALHLAESLGSDVHWASVGITGADVDRLREEGLPRLRDKIAAHRASGLNSKVVVVLVVGANELRKLKLMSYRLALRRLVDEVRFIENPDQAVDAVFLPALRIPDAPMLQRFPLRCVLNPVCTLWEREKRKAISWFRNVRVLTSPAPPADAQLEMFFSPDLMHPSSCGYDWWARSLAGQIHDELVQQSQSQTQKPPVKLQAEEFVGEHPLLSALRRYAGWNLCETHRLVVATSLAV